MVMVQIQKFAALLFFLYASSPHALLHSAGGEDEEHRQPEVHSLADKAVHNGAPHSGLMRYEPPIVHEGTLRVTAAPATGHANAFKMTLNPVTEGAVLTEQYSKATADEVRKLDQSPGHRRAPWVPPPDPAEEAKREMQRLREDSASARRYSERTHSSPEAPESIQPEEQIRAAPESIRVEETGLIKMREQRRPRDAVVAVHDHKVQNFELEQGNPAQPVAQQQTVARSSPVPRSGPPMQSSASPPQRSAPNVPQHSPVLTAKERVAAGALSQAERPPAEALSTNAEWLAILEQRPYLSAVVVGLIVTMFFLILAWCSSAPTKLQALEQQRQFARGAQPKRRLARPFAMMPAVREDGRSFSEAPEQAGMALSKARARPPMKSHDGLASSITSSLTSAGSFAASGASRFSATASSEGDRSLMGGTFARIQARLSGGQDRRVSSSPVAGEARRPLRQQQKIVVTCDVLEGRLGGILPDLGRLEPGCDPFVECRIVRRDPTMRPRGDVDRLANFTAQTEVKHNELSPKWNQTLAIPGAVYSEEAFVQLVLWDYDSHLERSYALAHFATKLDEALAGSVDEGHEDSRNRMKKEVFLHPVHQGEILALEAQLTVSFGFWEAHRYRLHIVSGSALPLIKSPGKISGYVEARVVRGDPFKKFRMRPGGECVWSARTTEIRDNPDPEWDQEFSFALACGGDPSLSLQLILWDSNLLSSKSPDVPVGHAVIKLEQITSADPGSGPRDHKLKLARLPAQRAIADVSQTELLVNTSFDLEFAG